ncbi:MAG: methyltransferase domain-containing protein [Alphaproteobacteria bacterium]|nr:methyltransferase domain-containing protein [Alphaproteobacteria bacterium]
MYITHRQELDMVEIGSQEPADHTPGLTLHAAFLYDLTVWLMTLGRERNFREKLLRLAGLKPGETVLDVGCGTGSLAIAAKRWVGPAGSVFGIDASPEMLARAQKKARKAGLDIIFHTAAAQALPFDQGKFDLVLNTLMLHHLPRKSREQCAQEISRVLKPGGCVLVLEFSAPGGNQHGLLSRFHRHGGMSLGDMIALFRGQGLHIKDSGELDFAGMQFLIATRAAGHRGMCIELARNTNSLPC